VSYRPEDDPKTALMRSLSGKTPKEQFANLKRAIRHCDKCDNEIKDSWNYCAMCGWQLVTVVRSKG